MTVFRNFGKILDLKKTHSDIRCSKLLAKAFKKPSRVSRILMHSVFMTSLRIELGSLFTTMSNSQDPHNLNQGITDCTSSD